MLSTCLVLEAVWGTGGGEIVCTHHAPDAEQALCSLLCLSESQHQPWEEGAVIIPILQVRTMENDGRESK